MLIFLSKIRRSGLGVAFLLGSLYGLPQEAWAAAKPYVETEAPRGFHLFLRPKQKTPADQWEFVQKLETAGKTRAAANQSLALRIYWPHAPEAPDAQLRYARLLELRGHPEQAFDAYQYLVEHYSGRFAFMEVVNRQMQIAKDIMSRKKGKFLFLPGFAAPERAIPYFEKVATNAPEGPHTAEAYYLIGVANQRTYEYEQAIDAYFTTINRFPNSPFAEKAAFAQVECYLKIAQHSPQDKRALATAYAAATLFLQRYPDSSHRSDVEASQKDLRARQIDSAYKQARYYDRILHNVTAALLEYRAFVSLYPDAEQTPRVRARIAELTSTKKVAE